MQSTCHLIKRKKKELALVGSCRMRKLFVPPLLCCGAVRAVHGSACFACLAQSLKASMDLLKGGRHLLALGKTQTPLQHSRPQCRLYSACIPIPTADRFYSYHAVRSSRLCGIFPSCNDQASWQRASSILYYQQLPMLLAVTVRYDTSRTVVLIYMRAG